MWWIWLVAILGVVVSLAFMGDWESDGGGCGGCLLLIIVVVLGFAILTGTH
jgi:hypothetical protein